MDFLLPKILQKRLLKFILKRSIGRFLGDELEMDQLEVELLSGRVQMRDLTLAPEAFDGIVPVKMVEGSVSSIDLMVPWHALRTEAVEIQITGTSMAFVIDAGESQQLTESGIDEDSFVTAYSSSHGSGRFDGLMQSSVFMANDFVKEVGDENLVGELEISPTILEQLSESTGKPQTTLSVTNESIHVIASIIDRIISNIKVKFTDTRVKLIREDGADEVVVVIPEISYENVPSDEYSRVCKNVRVGRGINFGTFLQIKPFSNQIVFSEDIPGLFFFHALSSSLEGADMEFKSFDDLNKLFEWIPVFALLTKTQYGGLEHERDTTTTHVTGVTGNFSVQSLNVRVEDWLLTLSELTIGYAETSGKIQVTAGKFGLRNGSSIVIKDSTKLSVGHVAKSGVTTVETQRLAVVLSPEDIESLAKFIDKIPVQRSDQNANVQESTLKFSVALFTLSYQLNFEIAGELMAKDLTVYKSSGADFTATSNRISIQSGQNMLLDLTCLNFVKDAISSLSADMIQVSIKLDSGCPSDAFGEPPLLDHKLRGDKPLDRLRGYFNSRSPGVAVSVSSPFGLFDIKKSIEILGLVKSEGEKESPKLSSSLFMLELNFERLRADYREHHLESSYAHLRLAQGSNRTFASLNCEEFSYHYGDMPVVQAGTKSAASNLVVTCLFENDHDLGMKQLKLGVLLDGVQLLNILEFSKFINSSQNKSNTELQLDSGDERSDAFLVHTSFIFSDVDVLHQNTLGSIPWIQARLKLNYAYAMNSVNIRHYSLLTLCLTLADASLSLMSTINNSANSPIAFINEIELTLRLWFQEVSKSELSIKGSKTSIRAARDSFSVLNRLITELLLQIIGEQPTSLSSIQSPQDINVFEDIDEDIKKTDNQPIRRSESSDGVVKSKAKELVVIDSFYDQSPQEDVQQLTDDWHELSLQSPSATSRRRSYSQSQGASSGLDEDANIVVHRNVSILDDYFATILGEEEAEEAEEGIMQSVACSFKVKVEIQTIEFVLLNGFDFNFYLDLYKFNNPSGLDSFEEEWIMQEESFQFDAEFDDNPVEIILDSSVEVGFKEVEVDDFEFEMSPPLVAKQKEPDVNPEKDKIEDVMRILLQGFSLEFKSLEDSKSESIIQAHEIEIFDHVQSSTWLKFLTSDKTQERDINAPMLKIQLRKFDNEENRFHAESLPLRCYIDQDALNFFVNYFSFSIPPLETSTEAAPEPIYFQLATVNSILLTVDYKPKKFRYDQLLQKSDWIQLLNVFPLLNSTIELKKVRLSGIQSWPNLLSEIISCWIPHIVEHQLPSLLKSLAPVKSLVNISSGLNDLIYIPLEEFQREGQVSSKAIKKGYNRFVCKTAAEGFAIGASLSKGIKYALQKATSNRPDADNSNFTRREPRNLDQGVRMGMESFKTGLHHSYKTIVAIPMEVQQKSSSSSQIKTVVRAIPIAVLNPIIGGADALSKTLLGLKNTVSPDRNRELDEKFKPA